MLEHSGSLPWSSKTPTLFGRAAHIGQAREILHELQDNLTSMSAWQFRIVDWKLEPDSFQSLLEHCKHKFLLHTAGRTYSARLKYLTLCGSAIIFPQDSWQEFWYGLLQNGTNVYIVDSITPENRGAPITDALQFLQNNDMFASKLAHGARSLAYEVLTKFNVNQFMVRLLQQYSELQDFTVVRHPDAVPLEESLLRPFISSTRTCVVCPSTADTAP